MADVNVPVVGKVNQKTLFIVAAIGIGVIGYIVYTHAKTSQKPNMGKPSSLVNGHKPSRRNYHYTVR